MVTQAQKSILIVEDDQSIAEVMAKALSREGYNVLAVASSGEGAIQKCAETRPDLVIMDVILRGNIDGIQAGKYIEDNHQIPIIYITGYPDKIEELQEKGKVPLLKPFTIEGLKTAIGATFYHFDEKEEFPNVFTYVEDSFRGKKLLIVEDNKDFSEPLAAQLKSFGFNIHASTQMAIHNLAGVKQLEQLGFKRIVLARGLSVAEIKNIAENTSIEIETFIHGALCYSYSGLCFFSSMIGGRSGNRGKCSQPCRYC